MVRHDPPPHRPDHESERESRPWNAARS